MVSIRDRFCYHFYTPRGTKVPNFFRGAGFYPRSKERGNDKRPEILRAFHTQGFCRALLFAMRLPRVLTRGQK